MAKSDWFKEALADIEAEKELMKEEADADQWEPDEGDILESVFLKAIPKATQYGIGYQLLVKDLNAGPEPTVLKVWAQRKTLREGVVSCAPAQGSLLMIQYVGPMKAMASGHTFHSYLVRSDKADPQYWNALELEAAAAQRRFDEASSSQPDDDELEAPF